MHIGQANNGGFTQTFALQTASPAIDAGTNAGCPADDQRGVLRPRNVTCDIGAYEYSSDATFPTVITTSLVASYITTGPSAFAVTFSENVADYAGNSNPNDVTNPVNYLLVENGADNAFNTASCAGGLLADDTQVAVIGVTYNAVTFTSNVTLSALCPSVSIACSSAAPPPSWILRSTNSTTDSPITSSTSWSQPPQLRTLLTCLPHASPRTVSPRSPSPRSG